MSQYRTNAERAVRNDGRIRIRRIGRCGCRFGANRMAAEKNIGTDGKDGEQA